MLVSIIVPAYNCQNSISKCIDSLINQTYRDIEIIVVDDGSKDETYNIVETYASCDKRIRLIRQKNGGPGAARNTGLGAIRGDYFSFVDSDDVVSTIYVESMLKKALQFDLDFVISNIVVDHEKKKKASGNLCLYSNNYIINKKIIQLIKSGKLNSPVAKLYRTSIQKKENVFMPTEIDLGEDLQFNLCFIQYTHKVGMLDENIYVYCTKNSNLTKKYRKNEFDIRVKNLKSLEKFLWNNDIYDKQFVNFLYLKLMYAECIQNNSYLRKDERLKRIRNLLDRKEIQNAYKSLKLEDILCIVMKYGCYFNNEKLVDFVAGILSVGKKIRNNIVRASI